MSREDYLREVLGDMRKCLDFDWIKPPLRRGFQLFDYHYTPDSNGRMMLRPSVFSDSNTATVLDTIIWTKS